jgi:hypothetical protein
MIAVQIARLVANVALFFDLCDEEVLDLDTAVRELESLGADLEALDKALLRELVDAFEVIAPEYNGESQKLVRRMARDFYLEEAIAADDPVRLAELDALREAED